MAESPVTPPALRPGSVLDLRGGTGAPSFASVNGEPLGGLQSLKLLVDANGEILLVLSSLGPPASRTYVVGSAHLTAVLLGEQQPPVLVPVSPPDTP
jgi:hypothetical protein